MSDAGSMKSGASGVGDVPKHESPASVAIDAPNVVEPRESESKDSEFNWKEYVIPGVMFAFYFLNYTLPGDVGATSDKYRTEITPPGFTFAIWGVIYFFELLFVLYPFFSAKARRSDLYQKRMPILWIANQTVICAWLIVFIKEYIIASTCLITVQLMLALAMFLTVVITFRRGEYPDVSIIDYVCIEVAFAMFLGWLTVATILNWKIFFIDLTYHRDLTASQGVTAQVVCLLLGYAVIGAAAALFATVPQVLDPVVHLPIIWALTTGGWRQWSDPGESLGWITLEFSKGVAIAGWVLSFIAAGLSGLAAFLLLSGKVPWRMEKKSEPVVSDQAELAALTV